MNQELPVTILNDEELRAVLARFPDTLWDWDDKRFTYAEYTASYREYKERFSDLFLALAEVCDRFPEEMPAIVREVCRRTAAEVAERIGALRGRNERMLRCDMCKMVAVIYFTPVVYELALPISERLAQDMHDAWIAHYPKDQYVLTRYEQITKGFERKWYQCYITQAVCVYRGLPDDCEQLQQLRAFRDGYLRSCPDGPALIAEYYRDAPQILRRIWASGDSDRIYAVLWHGYLMPCLRDIAHGRMAMCKRRYERMMRALRRHYMPWQKSGTSEFPPFQNGKNVR